MSDGKFDETHRDILIELRADMRHVREGVDHIRASDVKQWEKLDSHGTKIEGHDKSLGHLTWGFRLLAGGALTVLTGVAIFALTHGK